jgi:hypothetical protein
MNIIINIIAFILVIQLVIMKLFGISNFDYFSFIKNVFFCIIFINIFCKFKSKNNLFPWNTKTLYKNYLLLLIIPVVYIFQYLVYPTYLGQDILALPATIPGHLSINMQKLQNPQMHQQFLKDAHIDLNDTKYNFWYEYYHFIYDNNVYYFWLNRPGKFDELLNCLCYKVNLDINDRELILQTTIPKESYKSYSVNNYHISEINTYKLKYKLVINMINRIKKIYITIGSLNIVINGKITNKDHYGGIAVINAYIPITKIYKTAGVSDIYPYEMLNDTFAISDATISINNVEKKGLVWFDIYVGNGYYYMTNYLWTMNYSKNWNIFILFYTDYPYKGLVVSFFYDKKSKTTIESSNFWPNNNLNKLSTGTFADINVFNTRLTDNIFKYSVNYESPKIKCNIQSKRVIKALDNFPLYERLSKNKNYGKGEEVHTIAEQLRYDEFCGKSFVNIEYDGIIYQEESITVIDGVSWQPGKSGPDGYKKRDKDFWTGTFYVEHPNRDKLNGKL